MVEKKEDLKKPVTPSKDVSISKRPEERTGMWRREAAPSLLDLDPFSTSPFTFMRAMMDDMNRAYDLGRTVTAPAVEIFERGDQLVIRADLPGIKKDDVKVDIANGTLLIEGERRDEREQKGTTWYKTERSYGSFRRQIALPDGVDAESAKATFTDGVLEIVLKQGKPESTHVEIR